MEGLWITSFFPLGATRHSESYMGYRKAAGRTSDQSAMTRRTARKPEDDPDDQFAFRKKGKLISGSMIGESPKRDGASPNGSDGRRSSGDWTNCGLGTEAMQRKPQRGKPPTINALARKPDAEQAAAGLARERQPQQRRSGSLSSDKLPFFVWSCHQTRSLPLAARGLSHCPASPRHQYC